MESPRRGPLRITVFTGRPVIDVKALKAVIWNMEMLYACYWIVGCLMSLNYAGSQNVGSLCHTVQM